MIALYRFWPEARAAVRETLERAPDADAPPSATGAAEALTLAELAPTLGGYDLAVDLGAVEGAGTAGARALEVAEAVCGGRVWRGGGRGWAVGVAGTGIAAPTPAIAPFAGLAPETPLLLLRAMGGWNLLASPDRETWLTLSMTFLNRRTYQRFDAEAAWFSPDVNELASLVMGTHNTQDVEGTCLTYGIPGLSLAEWEDERQAEHSDGDPEATRSALLAEDLHYAALLPAPAGAASLREALAPLGSALFVEEAD